MHMAWVYQVCGRLQSRYRYSTRLVYNNLPVARGQPTTTKQDTVEESAKAVLDLRKQFFDATLADLYYPLAMPPALGQSPRQTRPRRGSVLPPATLRH